MPQVTPQPRAAALPLLALIGLSQAACPVSAARPAAPTPPRPLPAPAALLALVPRQLGPHGQVMERPLLVPVACRVGGELYGGQRCLDFLPEGEEVALEGGRRQTSLSSGVSACKGAYHRARGLSLPERVYGGYAVWPASRLEMVRPTRSRAPSGERVCRGWCSFGRTGHPRARVDAALRARLLAALVEAGQGAMAGEMELLQEVAVDLDGDGHLERLYSVGIPDARAEGYAFTFSGLFYQGGRPPGQTTPAPLTLVRRRDDSAVVVRGTVDLAGDGRRALWLLLSLTDRPGTSHELLTLQQGLPLVTRGYTCRPPRED